MKKLTIIFIALFGFVCIKAQTTDSLPLNMDSITHTQNGIISNTKLFIKLGVSQNSLSGHTLFNDALTGLEMGAHFQTYWSQHFFTEVGLNYVRKGASHEVIYRNFVNETVLTYTENIYLHYAQLPIVCNLHIPIQKNFAFTIGAGLYNAVLFSAWINPQHYYLNHEQAPNYQRYDMGVIGCLGIKYKNKFALTGRYEKGFMEISSNQGGTNNTLALSLSYALFGKMKRLED